MTLLERAIGAARLNVPIFEEIEANRNVTGQALAVVVVSSMAGGAGLSSHFYDAPVLERVVLALLLWLFWAALTYAIGVYLLPEPQTDASVGELLRTIGFAASPGVLRILGFVPGIGRAIYGLATAWMLVAMIVAIRQALDYRSTVRAAAVCLIAWLIALAMAVIVGAVFFLLVDQVLS